MSRREAIGHLFVLLGVVIVTLVLPLAGPAGAQTLTNTFGGLSESSDQPIDIESDMLTVYDAKKYATFKGNVKAVQGTTTLRAAELDVHYIGGDDKLGGPGAAPAAATNQATGRGAPAPAADQGAPASAANQTAGQGAAAPAANQAAGRGAVGGAKGQTRINKIEARGDVVITSEDDQTTTSDWALYDVPAQLVTVGGNVVLSQGENVLKGDRLVIDLKTGESRFENTGNAAAGTGGGRIRALFMPKGGGGGKKAEPTDIKPGAPADASAGDGEKPAGDKPEGQEPGNWGATADDGGPLPLLPEDR